MTALSDSLPPSASQPLLRQDLSHPSTSLSKTFSRSISLMCFVGSAFLLWNVHSVVAAQQPHSDQPSSTTTNAWWQGPASMSTLDKIFFGVFILMAFELLDYISKHSGQWMGSRLIPVRGKHLDDLSAKDLLFIGISKAATAPFVYFYLLYAYNESNVLWPRALRDTPMATPQPSMDSLADICQYVFLPLIPLYVVYDFFYTILHWFLHIKAIYGYIHKHHHHQKAPSRANVDAVNVHPVEFFLGEYNHLFVLYLCCQVIKIHIAGAFLFLAIGGVLAGINHTRYDVVISVPLPWKTAKSDAHVNGKENGTGSAAAKASLSFTLYDSKAHDVHHRIPQSNYGQYIMLWDHIFGSYRPYNPNDRVNPEAQLDPKTGKSLSYGKQNGKQHAQ